MNGESYYSDSALQIEAQEQSAFDHWMTPATSPRSIFPTGV